MGWGQRWPEREARPKARRLTETEKQEILATLKKGITASPVLSGFGVQVRAQRGRFYIERQRQAQDSEPYTEVWGRITPLAGAKKELLLERPYRKGSWSEVTRGQAAKLVKAIAGDTRGTFHGLVPSTRASANWVKGREVAGEHTKAGANSSMRTPARNAACRRHCSITSACPSRLLPSPRAGIRITGGRWIVEASKDRTRVLVWFRAKSMSGESFGGTCLYLQRDGQWGAYTIKPSESRTIASAEAWLVKRKWQTWC